MKRNEKILQLVMVIALIISITGISIGFASMSSSLNVSGVSEMTPASWKIKFDNLSSPQIVGDALVVTAPTITGDTHLGDYNIKLTKPGDSVVYTFDVINSGSIDAKLSTFNFTKPNVVALDENEKKMVEDNLIYTLTYNDGSSITLGDELLKGESKKLKLTVSYSMAATEIPINIVNINDMDITFVYTQK